MRVLIAPQEYKGTLTAVQAAEAMAAGVRLAAPKGEMDIAPMADGGPGTAAALIGAAGGEWRRAAVLDPLVRPIGSSWGLLKSGVAVIECAASSGLLLLKAYEFDPRRASTFVKCPDDQALATTTVAGGKDFGIVGLVIVVFGFDVGARITFDA